MKRRVVREVGLLIALAVVVIIFASLEPSFLGGRNISNLAVEFAISATLALGVFLVLLPGHTDLSTGSGVGMLGGLATVLTIRDGWPAGLAMLATLAVAVAVWAGVGWLVVRQRITAFIVTLGGLLVYRGLQWLMIHSQTINTAVGNQQNLLASLTGTYLPPMAGIVLVVAASILAGWLMRRDRAGRVACGLAVVDAEQAVMRWLVWSQVALFGVLLLNRFHGVPTPFLALAVVTLAVWVATQHTPFGRHLYAIGGNRDAAYLSGIRVDRTVIIAFAACGAVVALTGCLETAYTGATTTTVGTWMELDAIAACIIGGVSLSGGVGTVGGVLIGSLLVSTLLNGMTLHAVSPEWKLITRGGVLVLAAWLDVALNRR